MRVFTFQSHRVLNKVLKDGKYLADSALSRERRDYSEDVISLGGLNPIWVFSYKGTGMEYAGFLNYMQSGDFFIMAKCEMSLVSFEDLARFAFVELDVPEDALYPGLTHNACKYVYVIPQITKASIVGVYSLSYMYHWCHPVIVPVAVGVNGLYASFAEPYLTGKSDQRDAGEIYK